jgi:hypothetical protein
LHTHQSIKQQNRSPDSNALLHSLHEKHPTYGLTAACLITLLPSLLPRDTIYLQLDPNTAFIFQNFYCSHISIKQLQQRSQSSSSSSCSESLHSTEQQQWVTVLPHYALMASPHYEDDAQHWHVLPVSALTAAFDAASAAPLRVFLHQPSPLWDSMELRHFKCAVLPDPAEVCSCIASAYCRVTNEVI